ncbi:hypothetical protein DE159_003694 [Clostridium beijerinckii]|uniref:hypothetical protein n=1 Tax=Clostridium beijerinckii TaxID=1520 RepID=UPI00157019C2|nr:hypothetical protein [Clostridium beijerinckii]NRW29484.1 hypothetical protein [Clostridium beijerinckii]NRY78766.1 hypothetical protein [Clostridium beijerinckii]
MIDKFDQESGRTNSEDIEKSLEYSKKAIENKNYLEGEIKKSKINQLDNYLKILRKTLVIQ